MAALRRLLRGERRAGVLAALPRDVATFMRPRFHPRDIDDRPLIAGARDYEPMRALREATPA